MEFRRVLFRSTVLAENYPGTKVTEVHVGTVIAGTATKVRLLLAYNEAGHAHRLPPTMWLKGGFIRHAYTFDESFVNEAKFFATWAPEMNIHIPRAYWSGWHERSEEHTSELQSLMRNSYAVFCLKKKITITNDITIHTTKIS